MNAIESTGIKPGLRNAFVSAVLFILLTNVTFAQPAAIDEEIRERIERHQMSGRLILAGQDIIAVELLWKLYENRNYAPLWMDSARAAGLIDLVGRAEDEGLLPRDYHHETLVSLHSRESLGPGERADLDILLTGSLMRYVYHLYFGKVNPSDLDSDWNLARRLNRDPTALIEGAIVSDDLQQFISEALDWDPIYDQMRAMLADYRERAAREGGGYPPVPAGPTLRRGMSGPRVVALRDRLRASGHLSDDGVENPEDFDITLEQAVTRFQQEAQIDVDGAVGAGTLAALNISLQSRIDTIRVNMERARWILRDVRENDDFVLVNIADFKTMLYRDNQQVWETRSQVGRTYRKSPVFRADMRYAQFNPTWTVPPGILRRDIFPKLKAGAVDYLNEKDMKLVDSTTGQEVDPSSIDWDAMTLRTFRYQVVQRPGSDNALGQVKFIFPNPHFVFLHDTNHREHFDDEVRTFSSGCIRIEYPMEFARLVLDDPEWDDEAIQSVIDSKQTRTVYLKEPLPVLILYWTLNVVNADGEPRFLPDVYDRDGAILEALGKPFRFVPPEDEPEWLGGSTE
jgi:murein L,D-transpeptidase YcbB/YkuD